jgi:hypothetical protein
MLTVEDILAQQEAVADLFVLDRVNARLRLEALLTGIPLFVADVRYETIWGNWSPAARVLSSEHFRR